MNSHSKRKSIPRSICGVVLLVLLGLCGYSGAGRNQTKAVSVPVIIKLQDENTRSFRSVEETHSILEAEREREIELLNSVIENPLADASLIETALKQKTELVLSMEREARTAAALSYMGFGRTAVVCGAQTMSVFVPFSYMEQEHADTRIVDCVCTQTGFLPENVKIILSKNE